MYSVLSHRIVVVFGGCPCVVVAWVVGGRSRYEVCCEVVEGEAGSEVFEI